jgi:hypothetical protein
MHEFKADGHAVCLECITAFRARRGPPSHTALYGFSAAAAGASAIAAQAVAVLEIH